VIDEKTNDEEFIRISHELGCALYNRAYLSTKDRSQDLREAVSSWKTAINSKSRTLYPYDRAWILFHWGQALLENRGPRVVGKERVKLGLQMMLLAWKILKGSRNLPLVEKMQRAIAAGWRTYRSMEDTIPPS
jgi:hypothetical protein